jgi:hypothetical protein
MLIDILPSYIVLDVAMLKVLMLNVLMLNVLMLYVVMLSVVGPPQGPLFTTLHFLCGF